MAKRNEKMKALLEERDRLRKEIVGLQRELSGLERAIRIVDDVGIATERTGGKRPNVKGTILGVVNDRGALGVTVYEIVEAASDRGQTLDRGSVSSLLSRLKKEGTLTYDKATSRYYPMETDPIGGDPTETDNPKVVHPFHN